MTERGQNASVLEKWADAHFSRMIVRRHLEMPTPSALKPGLRGLNRKVKVMYSNYIIIIVIINDHHAVSVRLHGGCWQGHGASGTSPTITPTFAMGKIVVDPRCPGIL